MVIKLEIRMPEIILSGVFLSVQINTHVHSIFSLQDDITNEITPTPDKAIHSHHLLNQLLLQFLE